MRRRHSVGTEIIKGAIAGALATWIMDKVTTYIYERQPSKIRKIEARVSEGKGAYGTAAEKVARLAGVELDDARRMRFGSAIHWTMGITAGALYGALRARFRTLDATQGLPFGLGMWLVIDEVLLWKLGLAKAPPAYPWQTHARGLAGHVAYGLTADTALDVMDRAA